MKKLEIYIRPEKLEEVKENLESIQINGLSVTQVMGCGNQKGWTEYVRGAEIGYNFLTKTKIEIVLLNHQVESVVDMVLNTAHTGECGDGKIFISTIEEAIRIRTKERGEKAIS